MLPLLENKWNIKYIQTLPAPRASARENIGEGLHYKEIYLSKMLTLKTNIFEISDNKNIEKTIFKMRTAFLGLSLFQF